MILKKSASHLLLFAFLASLFVLAGLSSCSTFIGKEFDNTTARYNSYFLAKEKMKEIDVALKKNAKDDYHRILSIHYPSDSNFGKSQNAALEDVFKYASWSIRFHKRSKWADNSYILIGKGRHYQYNYKDGLETFKYVNATSTDKEDREESLIEMMKFFMDFNELDNVKYIIDYLDKEPPVTKKNKRDYLVAKAAYHQRLEEYEQVHALLDTALPLCNRKHDKARLRFINGQVVEYLKGENGQAKTDEQLDADAVAYKNYSVTLKSNPNYELWFNAKLNQMRVNSHSALKDKESARSYYRKMLADIKNTDYKDRIYYEFGKFEQKDNQLGKAEDYYKKSVKNATSNQRQKAYSYLALGEMYYDMQRFEDAKLYYDSTITILPKDHKGYGKIFRRQRILKDFVEHLTTIQREDSLQKLARMDTAALSQFLNDYIQKEEKRLNDEAKRLAKLAKKNAVASSQSPFDRDFADPNAPTGAPGAPLPGFNTGEAVTFYFYNSALALQGKVEFQQKWGRRRLEDFWRISAKDSEPQERLANAPSDSSSQSGDSSKTSGKNKAFGNSGPDDDVPLIQISKADLYKTIPSTEEKLKASHEKLQISLFKIGKIYNQHLGEPDNSVKSLNRFIEQYPVNENIPEAHYIIYLIGKGKDSVLRDLHKDILLTKYPTSVYAKIIQNPNYLAESKVLNKQIMSRYREAFLLYQNKDFKNSDSLLVLIQNDYPDSEFDPQIDLLRALMKARSGNKDNYRGQLQAYVDEYKTGHFHDYAQSLLDTYDQKKPKALPVDPLNTDSTSRLPSGLPQPGSLPQDSAARPANENQFPADMPEDIKRMYQEKMGRGMRGGTPPPMYPAATIDSASPSSMQKNMTTPAAAPTSPSNIVPSSPETVSPALASPPNPAGTTAPASSAGSTTQGSAPNVAPVPSGVPEAQPVAPASVSQPSVAPPTTAPVTPPAGTTSPAPVIQPVTAPFTAPAPVQAPVDQRNGF